MLRLVEKVVHREARRSDYISLAGNIRENDMIEIMSSDPSKQEISGRLNELFYLAEINKATILNGELLAVWGKNRTSNIIGYDIVFLITSKIVDENKKLFYSLIKEMLPKVSSGSRSIGNMVDKRYVGAIRMLEAIGFVKTGKVHQVADGSGFIEMIYNVRKIEG